MTQIISIVVAMNKGGIIGINNQLPWHIPEDLAHFKECTLNKAILMGRKTFESIGRVLPERRNILISRKYANYRTSNEDICQTIKINLDEDKIIKTLATHKLEVYSSIDNAIHACANEKEICIIGGGEIFTLALPLVDKIHLTIIDKKINLAKLDKNDSVITFPKLNPQQWKLKRATKIVSKNNIACEFQELIRQ